MIEKQSTYRQIFKATSIFGGVQVFNILISVIKLKVVAVLLGPGGIGLLGMLNSTLDVIKTITGLGLSSSAVKEVSQAAGSGDVLKISSVLKALRRWLYLTGIFGFLVTLALAPYLSQWTFGNADYTWSFVWLSVVLFLAALSSGQMAALQGLRRISYMAKSGMLGSLIGLLLSIPLFFFFSYEGIVPSIIISAICTLVLSSFYARKIKTLKVSQTFQESLRQGAEMVKLGIAMMFSGAMAIIAGYLLKAYITQNGGIDDAGIFQSGFSIAEGYFGLIFTAMATDYYPRLAAVNNNNIKVKDEVNKQAEMGLLLAFPIIIIALFLMPVLIKILYSATFMDSVLYVNWAMLGNIFKIGSWTMGYVLIAKGKSKIFTCTAIFFNSIYLFLNIVGYNYLGVEGIGIAFFIYYIIHFLGMYLICYRLFGIRYHKCFWNLFLVVLFLAIIAFYMQSVENVWIKYTSALLLLSISLYVSYDQINKRINIFQLISKKINRK
ncbi:O-antigen translocase [Bacteroides salyersiae]|uniref:O-antigen translocase n=1 Tax=Bacteroides salyersiae TaxID=291644 RepID=UPI001C8B63CE|nr:O-antigen translocase [Bacteroides salyersiae]